MSIFQDKIDLLNNFERNLFNIIKLEITEDEDYIADMNARDQLYEKGVNALGISIADYMPYTQNTITLKLIRNQPANRVTLYNDGDFHRSFYLEIYDDSFYITASDRITEDLIIKYGEDIFGLTNENIMELIWEYIYPRLINDLKLAV